MSRCSGRCLIALLPRTSTSPRRADRPSEDAFHFASDVAGVIGHMVPKKACSPVRHQLFPPFARSTARVNAGLSRSWVQLRPAPRATGGQMKIARERLDEFSAFGIDALRPRKPRRVLRARSRWLISARFTCRENRCACDSCAVSDRRRLACNEVTFDSPSGRGGSGESEIYWRLFECACR